MVRSSSKDKGQGNVLSAVGIIAITASFVVMFSFTIVGNLFPSLGFPSVAYLAALAVGIGMAIPAGWKLQFGRANLVGIIVGLGGIGGLLAIQIGISVISSFSPFNIVRNLQIGEGVPRQFLPLLITPYITGIWAASAGVVEEQMFYSFLYKVFRKFGTGVSSWMVANLVSAFLFAGFHIAVALAVGKVTNIWEFLTFPFIISAAVARIFLNVLNDTTGGDATVSMVSHGGMNAVLTFTKTTGNIVFPQVGTQVGVIFLLLGVFS